MNLCSITPVKQCAWSYEAPMVMLLTHLVERHPEYVKEALKHPNTYKILDNSLIELGESLTMERLVSAAEIIKADEIILPDVFRDGPATIESTKKAIEWLKMRNLIGKYKLMVVCHGNNEEEWANCFNQLNQMEEVDVIGVPKVTATWLKDNNRKNLSHVFLNTTKQIHLLGSWYNLAELLRLGKNVWDRVRSADTCLPSLYVIQNKHIWEDRAGTIDLEKDYPELTKEKYDKVMDEFEREMVRAYIYIGY